MCGCQICYKDEKDILNQLILKSRLKYISFEKLSISKKKIMYTKLEKMKNHLELDFFALYHILTN